MTISVPNVTLDQLIIWINNFSMFSVVATLMFLWYVVVSCIINGDYKFKGFKFIKKLILMFYPYGLYRWFLYGTSYDCIALVIMTIAIGGISCVLLVCFADQFEPQKIKDIRSRNKYLEKEIQRKDGIIENYRIDQIALYKSLEEAKAQYQKDTDGVDEHLTNWACDPKELN